MNTDKNPSIRLSFILTAIVFCLTGIGLYAKTLALIAPSIATICLIWAAYHFFNARSVIRGRSILLIFTAYITWFACLTGGIFSPGLFFLIIVLTGTVLFTDLPGFLFIFGLCSALVAFFYFGPSWGPGALNLNKFRLVFFIILFSGIGTVLFLVLKREQALIAERQAAVKFSETVQEDAKNAIEVKDRFLANMSHEIRNPMNGVLGMLHVLLDSKLDAEQRRYADIAYNSARALLTIVNDILDLSKIEAEKVELDIRPFDLEIAIKDIISLPELQARQKGLEFIYNIDTDVPRLLKGDIGRIRQVILNFTNNAVKFTETGSVTLNVTLKEDTEEHALIYFSVDDTGIGMNEEVCKGLFSPFVQADASITKKYGGTGLGLFISKLFIELMGGQVGVDSIEMIGSTFWFEVPFEKQLPEEIAQDLSAVPVDEIRVVAVSDKPEPSTRLTKILDRSGVDYETCEHDRVIELVTVANTSSTPFHVVVMEVNESDQYARAIGRKISQHPDLNSLVCILVTAVGKQGDAKEFEGLGFSAFLSFPLDRTILQDAIHTVLSPVYQKSGQAIITRYALAERRKRAFKILIVDDIEANVLTAKAIISKHGYQTDAASNGIQAVEKVKRNKYDLIFMDCRMPEMDGYEACRQIRAYEALEKHRTTPIIAMTGNAFERDRQTCKEAGMDDFISKPVNPQALIELINAYKSETLASEAFESPDFDMPEREIHDLETQEQVCAALEENDAPVPVFDKTGFLERFGNDEELAGEILDSFLQEVEGLVENLVSAVKKEPFDPEYTKDCAHALKGAAANVNAEQLRRAALDIETRTGNDMQLDTLVDPDMLKACLNRFNRKARL
ncbi:response regulator [Desulfobacter latus]|uniref:Sensory/regulatory protein RpfC n=1 Tax=Desulfobacter latus TaxID=2292 RepID=A0A850TCF9_9BACT|nr:response regulator [Desulfobacter latus]NWH05076.1 response regulator [Desulfobacter latus]